jgi:hypothetical protein
MPGGVTTEEWCAEKKKQSGFKTEARLWNVIEASRRAVERDDWLSYIAQPAWDDITLGDWAHTFVINGLIPFLAARGFALATKGTEDLYVERHLLHLLYSLATGTFMRLPAPKHRDSEADRWLYEQSIGGMDWDTLLQRWEVDGVAGPSTRMRELFPEFVYVFISPEKSRIIQDYDDAERRAREADDTYRQENEGLSWNALRATAAAD